MKKNLQNSLMICTLIALSAGPIEAATVATRAKLFTQDMILTPTLPRLLLKLVRDYKANQAAINMNKSAAERAIERAQKRAFQKKIRELHEKNRKILLTVTKNKWLDAFLKLFGFSTTRTTLKEAERLLNQPQKNTTKISIKKPKMQTRN